MMTIAFYPPVWLVGTAIPHPVLARYGESTAANQAIATLLQSVVPAPIPGKVGVGRFSADANDVWAHAYPCGNWMVPLSFFRPYFSTLPPHDLCRLVDQSFTDDRHQGRVSFGLFEEDEEFLTRVAFPVILAEKIARAKSAGSTTIHVTIKSLGIGDGAAEMRQLVHMAVEAFRSARLEDLKQTGTFFSGDIRIACLAFDVSLSTLYRMPETAYARYETYYADLTDPASRPTALAYGTPDITCWRNTHVLHQNNENGFAIVDAIRENLAVPGALLVYEGSRLGIIDLREYKGTAPGL